MFIATLAYYSSAKIGEVGFSHVCFQYNEKETMKHGKRKTTLDPNPNTLNLALTLAPTQTLPIELCLEQIRRGGFVENLVGHM